MQKRVLLVLPLAALLVAAAPLGLLATGGGEHAPAPLATARPEYAYACPPGGEPRADGLCVSSIADPLASEQEPFLAIHPFDPRIMALSTNRGGDPAGPLAILGGELVFPAEQQALRVTEDGGATWRTVVLPAFDHPHAAPMQARPTLDPTLAFDGDGRLHISGLVIFPGHGRGMSSTGNAIFYAASDDLGATWMHATLLPPFDSVDRPWLTALHDGRVYITTLKGSGATISWSDDGGVTWRFLSGAESMPSCTPASPMILDEDGPLFACIFRTADIAEWRAYRFDPEEGEVELLSTMAFGRRYLGSDQWNTLLARAADGTLVAQVQEIIAATREGDPAHYVVWLMSSVDGGMTWSEPVDLATLVSLEERHGWDYVETYWIEADPWGAVHMLLYGCKQVPTTLPASTCPLAAGTEQHAHIVLDPSTLELLHERELTSSYALDQLGPPIGGGIAIGDHFGAIAFAPDHGVLVWTRYAAPSSYASTHNGVGVSLELTTVVRDARPS